MAAQDDAYKKALKQIDDLVKKQSILKKSTDSLKDSWSSISSELFKIDGASFFEDVKKTPAEVAKIGEEVLKLQDDFKILGKKFSESLDTSEKAQMIRSSLVGAFEEAKQSASSFYGNSEAKARHIQITQDAFNKKLTRHWDIMKQNNTELATISGDVAKTILEQIAAGKTNEEILLKTGDAGRQILAAMTENKEEALMFARSMNQAADGAETLRKSATETSKEFNLIKGFSEGIATQLKKGMIPSLMKFDNVLHDVQKNTGIMMDTLGNSQKFSDLTIKATQFGVSVEEAGQQMANMSKELNTTNFGVLSKATEDFLAIEGATGAASGDITNIAGELMRMGESSGQVKDFMEGADQEARKFGVSSSKVIGGIGRNIKKIREMGFVGGEKSLTKMAITAERLRMNMDETFDTAKRARSIEGAMDMAAELQLAGGSFANINPMDLLAAARKGPAELQKILTGMGKDIGHFSQETGKYEFDPIDVDRLQMVSEATGQSMESLQNMIQKNAEDTEKLNPFQGMIDGLKDADQEIAKSALSDMMKRGKDGKMEIDVNNDMAKKMGITDLAKITPEMMNNILEQKNRDAQTLEEQNKRNQSLSKSWDNFINALMSVMSAFQPILEVLTTIMQGITSAFTEVASWGNGWGKWILAGLVSFGVLFGTNVGLLVGKFLGGFGNIAKAITNPKKAIGGLMGKLQGGAPDISATEAVGKKGMDMANMWETIKNKISSIATGIKDVVSGVLGFIVDVVKNITSAVSEIIKGVGGVLKSIIGVLKDVVSGIGDIFVTLMSSVGKGITAFASSAAVGLAILTPFIPIIIVLTAVIIGLAFAFKIFAEGLAALAPVVTAVFNGIATVVLAVGNAVSMVINTIADSIVKLSNINVANLFALALGLGALSLALMAFGAGSLVGGIASLFGGGMFEQITMMAMLAPAIETLAVSLNSIADGITKISAAAENLSLEKLEKLKELSETMAKASSSGSANAIANAANSNTSGKGDGEVRKIEVNVKMNGRDLQNFIVKDTAILK